MRRWERCYWCDTPARIEEESTPQPEFLKSVKRWFLAYPQACGNGHPLWTEYRTRDREIEQKETIGIARDVAPDKTLFYLGLQPRTDVSQAKTTGKIIATITLLATLAASPSLPAYTNTPISERFLRVDAVENTKY